MSEPEDHFEDVYGDLAVLIGSWANGTRVHRGRDEFTVDFLRHVPERSRRVLVARALVPPLVAFELRDQLAEHLRGYYEWSMPEGNDDG